MAPNSIYFANKYTEKQLAVILNFVNDRCKVCDGTETGDYFSYLRGEIKQAIRIVDERKVSIFGGLSRLDRI